MREGQAPQTEEGRQLELVPLKHRAARWHLKEGRIRLGSLRATFIFLDQLGRAFFSPEEKTSEQFLKANAHLIYRFAASGGIKVA